MTKRTAASLATLRTMAEAGQTATEIARALGVSIPTVVNWAAECRVRLPSRSEASKKAWSDPAVRAKMSEASKKAWSDPAVRAKMSEARKKALADPAVRAKMSEARKKAWSDPAVRAKMISSRRARAIDVPRWVAVAGLTEEFLDVAEGYGEEAAASRCRKLKREMAVA